MTEDDEFRGYFPGSRTPLPTATKPKVEVEKKAPTAIWDSRPIHKIVNGQTVDFFSIGSVCAALGRPAVTIRLWIRKGYLPVATYRMPDRGEIKGRRLYTRAQIEELVKVLERHGLLGAEHIVWRKHTTVAEEIRRAWSEVRP